MGRKVFRIIDGALDLWDIVCAKQMGHLDTLWLPTLHSK
jgi:hypothetical protein